MRNTLSSSGCSSSPLVKGTLHSHINTRCGLTTSNWAIRPYFGQAFWFRYQHSEKLPSALERYQKEVLRVFGVLENVLSKQEWLVGGKLTVADLSFITYVCITT